VRLLLDTHVWVWRRLAPERLSDDADRAVADRDSTLHLSPISTWETFTLARQGRPSLRPSPSEWVSTHCVELR
jgi:PIN domain nuclease of toxin-antitoxin system